MQFSEIDCERIGTGSVADLTYQDIRSIHSAGPDIKLIAEIAAAQVPPNLAVLGLLKAVVCQQKSNELEYGYGKEQKESLDYIKEKSELIDGHIRNAEQESGQQG